MKLKIEQMDFQQLEAHIKNVRSATLLIETFPDIFRRCRLSEGRYGVKIITAKINVESSTDSSEEVFEN